MSDTPSKPKLESKSKLSELGDEFGVYRLDHETDAEFAHRLLAELAEMIEELKTTQRLIQQLIA